MIQYYIPLTVFAIIAYVIIVDPNVTEYIILLLKFAYVQFRRSIFLLKFYPRLMIDRLILKIKLKKILKQVDNSSKPK